MLFRSEWRALQAMSVEQLKGRILMRNAQFSFPLSGPRLADALAGRCAPLTFDYQKASQALAA